MTNQELQSLQQSITSSIVNAETHIQQASRANGAIDSVQAGLSAIKQAEQYLVKYTLKSNQIMGLEGNNYRKTAAQFRQRISTLKTQLDQLQGNAQIEHLTSDLHNAAYLHQQQDNTRVLQQTALLNLNNANTMARDANEELGGQNEKMVGMSMQNERINRGLRRGQVMADIIKCNEVKHMYLQATLITGMLVLTIAAIIVKCVL